MPQINLLYVANGKVKADLKCSACNLCSHPTIKTQCLYGEGPTNAKIMFVAYHPGQSENNTGRIMVGPNGALFRDLLADAGIFFPEVYVTNCLKCYPGDEKIKFAYWEACRGHLQAEINKIKPKIIISVGSSAFHWLTGHSGMKRFRKRGIPCILDNNLWVFPIRQPSALFHAEGSFKTQLRNEIVLDLKYIREKLDDNTLLTPTGIDVDYKIAKSLKDVDSFLTEFADVKEISCDLETSSLFPDDGQVITIIGLSKGIGHGRAIPLYAWGLHTLHYWTDKEIEGYIIPKLREFLKTKKVFGHNFIQFDQKWLRKQLSIHRCHIDFDTMLVHYLLDEEKGTHDLEQIALVFAGISPWKTTPPLKDTLGWAKRCMCDVDANWRIRKEMEKQLSEKQWWLLRNIIIPLSYELMEIEYRGVDINLDNLDKLDEHLQMKINEVSHKLHSIPEVAAYEFNENTTLGIDNPNQLAIVMEHYLKLPCKGRTLSKRYATNKEVLGALSNYPFIQLVQQIRGLRKLQGTYCNGIRKAIRKDGRIHTNYKIPGTVTGRLASKEPNLQNITRKETAEKVIEDGNMLKNVFCASEGSCLLQADYSQIELRVLAMYSKDPTLKKIFDSGQDVHKATAAVTYDVPYNEVTKIQRTGAKSVNFGIIYGRHISTIAAQFEASGSTKKAAYTFYDMHKKRFPLVWKWMNKQEEIIKVYNYQETFFGRIKRYSFIDQHAIRQAYNFPIQGTAADFTYIALIKCSQAFRQLTLKAFPVLTTHDDIIFNIDINCFWETAQIIKTIMEGITFPFVNVPLIVDMGAGLTWGSLRKVDLINRKLIEI